MVSRPWPNPRIRYKPNTISVGAIFHRQQVHRYRLVTSQKAKLHKPFKAAAAVIQSSGFLTPISVLYGSVIQSSLQLYKPFKAAISMPSLDCPQSSDAWTPVCMVLWFILVFSESLRTHAVSCLRRKLLVHSSGVLVCWCSCGLVANQVLTAVISDNSRYSSLLMHRSSLSISKQVMETAMMNDASFVLGYYFIQ